MDVTFELDLKNPCVDWAFLRVRLPDTITTAYTVSGNSTVYKVPDVD